MLKNRYITTIIPALNEELSVGKVIGDLPGCIDQIIVVDNGSTDRTAGVARDAGAVVLLEPNRGYGSACLRALASLTPETDIVLFIDADYSDFPEEAEKLLLPVAEDSADMVIGSRMLTLGAHNALPPVAAFGNWLSTRLIKIFWGVRFTDLGPFRAISRTVLDKLKMADTNFGWTVEMQIKAAKLNLRCLEVPVGYRSRSGGKSKVSGTVSGSLRAGLKILYLIFKSLFTK
jgi:glycosyltransferase involved in cell wall biosynthesis